MRKRNPARLSTGAIPHHQRENGITLRGSTNTNKLEMVVPDELKGVDLQIIILPAEKAMTARLDFFSDEEPAQLSAINAGTALKDEEDYAKR